MKKLVSIIALVVFGLVLTACTTTSSTTGTTGKTQETTPITIQFGGSTSVEDAIEAAAEAFKAEAPRFLYVLNQTGSSDGWKRTLGSEKDNNPAHIGFASRALKSTEVTTDALSSGTFARDGIAVVVHKDNPVTSLTKEQVLKIYTGEINDWNQVSTTKSGAINVYTRDAASGTRGAFQEIIGFESNELVTSAITSSGNGDEATKVGNDVNGIGYVSLSTDFNANNIKALQSEGVDATKANVLAGTYTIARPFVYVTRATNDFASDDEKAMVAAFIAYLGTKDAMAVMAATGVIVDDTNAPVWEDISAQHPITR